MGFVPAFLISFYTRAVILYALEFDLISTLHMQRCELEVS